MKRLLDLLGSLRLTIGLLVALATLFLLGLVIPQKQVLQRELYTAWQESSPRVVALLEWLELTDIYRSPLALAMWGMFFANLAVVMGRRVPAIRKQARLDGEIPDPASAPGFTAKATVPLERGTLDQVASFLARRFAVQAHGERIRAVKWRYSPWATLAFHLSFFLVAIGGAASFYTRFEGSVDLGSGEEFTGELAQYVPVPRLPRIGTPPRVRFTVERIAPEVVGDFAVGLRVDVRDERMLRRTLEVNRPLELGDTAFVFRNLGVAPLLIVQDATGREVFGGYLRLNVLQHRKEKFELVGQQLEAELFPDYFRQGDEEGSRSQDMRDPVLRLSSTAPDGQLVRASMRPGEAMQLGPYVIAFADWRYWVRLYVRSERGLGLVWLGFGLGALAVACRLFLYRREYILAIAELGDGRVLHLAGRADYYRALFADEADALARDLRATLEPRDAPPPSDRRAVS
jgi:hypothetical protein